MFAELPAMPEPPPPEVISLEDIIGEDIPPEDIPLPEAGPAGIISDELALVEDDVDELAEELPEPEPEPQAANSGETAAPAAPAPRMRSSRRRFIAVARSRASKSEPVTIDLRVQVDRPMTHQVATTSHASRSESNTLPVTDEAVGWIGGAQALVVPGHPDGSTQLGRWTPPRSHKITTTRDAPGEQPTLRNHPADYSVN